MKDGTNFGFIEPELIETDWVLSGEYEKLQPNADWTEYLPRIEYQRKYGVETSACVTFTMLNCIEILHKRLYDVEPNYSERYNAILGDTGLTGASPQKVVEACRKKGCIPQDELPFVPFIKSWDAFHSPNPMEKKYLDMGKEWLRRYELNHDWVVTPDLKLDIEAKQMILMKALQHSPLLVSVDAWKSDGVLYIKDKGARDNHATTLYGFKYNEYWKIFDSYDATHKKLAWDYDFGWAKRFVLKGKEPNLQESFVEKIIRLWINLLTKLFDMVKFKV